MGDEIYPVMYYDYHEEVETDVIDYIDDEIDLSEYEDLDDLEENLRDKLWSEDRVTGNASGSYTFNRSTAQEYVMGNIDLLKAAYEEFDCKESFANDFFNDEWEKMDVLIRLYVLPSAISSALEYIKKRGA